jgi:hypothetical protein
MSDPVSNVEIEDVLSSIRRLVSEENRPALRRPQKDVPNKPTRLVLTPSLLVPVSQQDEPEDETAQQAEAEPADDTAEVEQAADLPHDRPETADEDTTDEDSVAPEFDTEPDSDAEMDEFTDVSADEATNEATDASTYDLAEDPDDESGQDAETDAFEDPSEFVQDTGFDSPTAEAPWVDPDATLFEAADSADASDTLTFDDSDDEDPADDPFSRPQEDSFSEASQQPDDQSVDAGAPEEPGLSASVPPDWWEASAPPEDAPQQDTGDDEQDMAQSGLADPAAETAAPEPAEPENAETDPDGTDPLNTSTLSDKIAALEAKIGQTQDQWEPDGETEDDYAGTPVETIQWQDHDAEADTDGPETDTTADKTARTTPPEAEPEIEATLDTASTAPHQNVPQDDDDILDLLPEDDTILDEESLRELVADIVRQELQGALGERITRNVRKLVRREIHRALTAQELD